MDYIKHFDGLPLVRCVCVVQSKEGPEVGI